jgi:hypothetical protein
MKRLAGGPEMKKPAFGRLIAEKVVSYSTSVPEIEFLSRGLGQKVGANWALKIGPGDSQSK